jgi:NDP-sugar pyrophosphorylase family protein
VEAIVLAGGKAERLGEAAQGKPKPLVPVAGRPLVAYQLARLARAGVNRVIVACAAGRGEEFERELADAGLELVVAEEPEPLGRGGGIRMAAAWRRDPGEIIALNGDELVDVDFAALLDSHRGTRPAATIAVARPPSPFGLVDIGDDDVVTGFSEGGRIPYWVNCGIYVLEDESIERFPARGDHETTAFPELAAEGRLRAFRHEGLWLTVNTPKDLRRAEEHVAAHPEWLAA